MNTDESMCLSRYRNSPGTFYSVPFNTTFAHDSIFIEQGLVPLMINVVIRGISRILRSTPPFSSRITYTPEKDMIDAERLPMVRAV